MPRSDKIRLARHLITVVPTLPGEISKHGAPGPQDYPNILNQDLDEFRFTSEASGEITITALFDLES